MRHIGLEADTDMNTPCWHHSSNFSISFLLLTVHVSNKLGKKKMIKSECLLPFKAQMCIHMITCINEHGIMKHIKMFKMGKE
jgi:hypothetical protein